MENPQTLWDPVPVLSNFRCENFFISIQLDFPSLEVMTPHPFVSHPFSVTIWEKSDIAFSTMLFWLQLNNRWTAGGSPLYTFLLQVRKTQLSQPFFIYCHFHPFIQLSDSSLVYLHFVGVCRVLGSPKIGSDCRGIASTDLLAIASLCSLWSANSSLKAYCWLKFSLWSTKTLWKICNLPTQSALQSGIILTHLQDFTFTFIKFHQVPKTLFWLDGHDPSK